MKRIFISLIILSSFVSTLLAQARLEPVTSSIELGQVEWDNPVTIEFRVKNSGKIPLLIADVMSSCGCSVPHWSSRPIEPGMESVISVVYDAKTLGKFHKEITVYSNSDTDLTYLSFTGQVVRKITEFKNSHPIKIGNIRLDRDTLSFGTLVSGKSATELIHFVNETGAPYRPILMHTPTFMSIKSSDSFVARGESGSFSITVNTDRLDNYGVVDTELYLSRFVGDKVGKENRLPVSFIVIPDLNTGKSSAPQIKLNKSHLNLSAKLKTKNKASGYVTIENEAANVLKILKIQTFSPAVQVRLNKSSISRGDVARLRITVDKNKRLSPDDSMRVLLITNDPNNTVINLNM